MSGRQATPLVTENAVEWGVIAHLRGLPHWAPSCPLCQSHGVSGEEQ